MARKLSNVNYIGPEELKTLSLVSRDIFYFAMYVYVVNPVLGRVRFDLYPYQKSVLLQFLKERFNIILKFRQAGITELISMYCLWLAMYHPNKKINIISIKDTVAKKVLKKIKFMYKNLPLYLQTPISNGRTGEYGSASTIEFNNGSIIESIPTSDQAGRSESLSLLVIDEAAIVRWASTIWASAFPTLSCLVGDTPIFVRQSIGNKTLTKTIDIQDLCPSTKGVVDISNRSYFTLTHKGNWKKITHGVHKGILKTWYVMDCRGKVIGATPKHRFYTTKGWKTLEDILENNIEVIQVDTKITEFNTLEGVLDSSNRCPNLSIRGRATSDKEIKPRIYTSSLTLVKETLEPIYDITVEDDHSFISSNNFVNHNTGGSAIVNSTPYGVGSFYHSTWVDAISGGNPFNPIRLNWRMHPDRDDAWYSEMASALGPKRTAQEIDGDFLSSGNTVFDLTDIKAIEDMLPEYPVIQSRFNGQYKRFLDPNPQHLYAIGADCGTGRSSDYSAFTCMDSSGEESLVFKGKIPLNQFARLLGDTGRMYNYAKLAPETNDIGMAVTTILQDEGYPNLYHSTKLLRAKKSHRPEEDKIPGWLTTQKNRSLIIEGLEKDIREDNIIVKDPFFVQEAATFIYDGSGRPVARGKHNRNTSSVDLDLEGEFYADDSIFAKAITNHIRKAPNYVGTVLPQ